MKLKAKNALSFEVIQYGTCPLSDDIFVFSLSFFLSLLLPLIPLSNSSKCIFSYFSLILKWENNFPFSHLSSDLQAPK